ncbi:hypothetical protein [Marinobacter litoralis]|uniref:hypothetical protein n=1 Tax=Marinobacter litoralis TaxID=187981 RepID=UPI0018EBD4CC|nr:hypothetical protein [Marinobacter litoralis]MBJ6137122.1 hypothetical protein [Marinobacter litoralis]
MDAGQLWTMLPPHNLSLLVAAGASLLALVALLILLISRRRNQHQITTLKQRIDSLWREVDDMRVVDFNQPLGGKAPDQAAALEQERYRAEKAAYDLIWPTIWQLHDHLGVFLRAVEAGDSANELRLEARQAAIEARTQLNQSRPFCSETVENLASRLIDTEIKAHLAACEHLDKKKELANAPDSQNLREFQDKCHTLHNAEARELLNQLASSIRHRTLRDG